MCQKSFPGARCSLERMGIQPSDPSLVASASGRKETTSLLSDPGLAKGKWPVESPLLSHVGQRYVNPGSRYGTQNKCWPMTTFKVVIIKVHYKKGMKYSHITTRMNLANFMLCRSSKPHRVYGSTYMNCPDQEVHRDTKQTGGCEGLGGGRVGRRG